MISETVLFLFGAGVVAGAINAIAGGGTFFSFPVLIWAGLPPLVANTTNMVALMPANGAALPALRKQLFALGRRIVAPTVSGLLGGTCGALLLFALGADVFANAVPYLIGFATLLFAFAPTLRRRLVEARLVDQLSPRFTVLIVFVFAIYGGYFGAGIGQIMLAALMLAGFEDLAEANALKNLVVLTISAMAVVIFALSGTVHWHYALVMMISSSIGGYFGGWLSVVAPQRVLRAGIIAFGCFLTAYYFVIGT